MPPTNKSSSPPRSQSRPRSRPSPKRRPLHERSNSEQNTLASPSVRLVEKGSNDYIYASTPFPTKPTQVLRPKNGQGLGVFEDEGARVSESTYPSEPPAPRDIARHEDAEKKLEDAPETHPSISAVNASSLRSSGKDVDPGPSNVESQVRHGLSSSKSSDDVIYLPSPELEDVIPEESSHSLKNSNSAESALSGSSEDTSSSQDTVKRYRNRASYSAFPTDYRPTTARSYRSATAPITPASQTASANASSPIYVTYPLSPIPQGSSTAESSPIYVTYPSSQSSLLPQRSPDNESSPIYARYPPQTSSSHNAPSSPSPAQIQPLNSSEVSLQYPQIRPPSASGSWAESSAQNPKRLSRMTESTNSRWAPHLSTVPSEMSPDRSTRPSESHSRLTPSSALDDPTTSPPLGSPQPLFAQRRNLSQQTAATGSTIRIVDEDEDERGDNLAELQAPALRSKTSGWLSMMTSSSSRRNSRASDDRPDSRQSYMARSVGIPGWARRYYSRGERDPIAVVPSTAGTDSTPSLDPTDSRQSMARSFSPSTNEYAPTGIFLPRRRPHEAPESPSRLNWPLPQQPQSGDEEESDEGEIEVRGPPAATRVPSNWAPRLARDRRSGAVRRSLWSPPSFNEKTDEPIVSRRNAQLIMFCVGFVFPFGKNHSSDLEDKRLNFAAWMIAAFLPLPHKSTSREGNADAEQQLEINFVAIRASEARYENARWWRNVNRGMSAVGVLVIGAVVSSISTWMPLNFVADIDQQIALAVVGSRMASS